jgi:hypothetical protein
MSDQINTLIHSNARNAFDQGVKRERQRILEIVHGFQVKVCSCDACKTIRDIEDEIKGEQK